MPTVGCNSGIGNAWARLLLEKGYTVYATDINVGEPLKSLESKGKCTIAQLDVTSPDSIKNFHDNVLGAQTPVDILLNVAGIMIHPPDDSFTNTNLKIMETSFAINTYGPILLTQAIISNILLAPAPRRVAVISSRVSSMADNSSGGAYAYRASKAAVNSMFKSLAEDMKKQNNDVIVAILHPGFTNTNLGDMTAFPGVVEPEEAAAGLWGIVEGKGMEDTGKFWHRNGMELPW